MKSNTLITALGFIVLSCQGNISTITGKVVGVDGKPALLAHVHLLGAARLPDLLVPLDDPVLISEVVQKDGTFKISTRETGPFVLLCTAVGHKQLRLPLPLETYTDVAVDIQLAGAIPDTSKSEIFVLTTIDGRATRQQTYLEKQSNGTFRVDVPTIGDSLGYMVPIGNSDSRATSLIGATAHRYELNTRYEYEGIVPVTNGHAIIDYRVPQLDFVVRGNFHFHDSTSTNATFAQLQQFFVQHVATSYSSLQNHMQNGNSFSSFKFPWMKIADTLAHTAGLLRDGLLKDEMALEVLECYFRGHIPLNDRRLRDLIAGVSPTSLAWAYHGSLGLVTQRIPEMGPTYFASLVNHHPWRSYAALLLFQQCADAKLVHDDSTMRGALARLAGEFANTPGARQARTMFGPRDEIRIGSPLPEFAFPSADDSSVQLTNAMFRGQHLLMVFWGTWCSPCVAEMPVLHRINEQYGKSGLRLLSVALDNEPIQIERFRKVRWTMPWSVAFVSRDKTPAVRTRFAAGVGTHILVNPQGNILMIDSLLNGNQLDSTLAQLLVNKQ